MCYRCPVQPQTQGTGERVHQSGDVGWKDSECVNGLLSIEFMALGETTHGDRDISKGPDTDLRHIPHRKKLYIL